MNGFRFRLEQVLEFRGRTEDLKKKEMSDEMRILVKEESVLGTMYEDLRGSLEFWDREKQHRQQADSFRMHHRYIQHLEQGKKSQMLKIRDQEKRVEEARNNLIKAGRDRKVLEKLKERQQQAHQSKLDRAERIFLDDIATRSYYDQRDTRGEHAV